MDGLQEIRSIYDYNSEDIISTLLETLKKSQLITDDKTDVADIPLPFSLSFVHL